MMLFKEESESVCRYQNELALVLHLHNPVL